MSKKGLSLILSLVMILSAVFVIPVTASAQTADAASGEYESWEEAYRWFVLRRRYTDYVKAEKRESVRFSLFDLDGDGVQELVVLNLEDFQYLTQRYGYDVFTFKNGSVEHMLHTYLNGSIAGHIRSNRYFGAFGGFTKSFNSATFYHYYIKNGNIYEEPIAAFPGNNTLTRKTSDKNLYQVFLDATIRGTTTVSGKEYNTCSFKYRGEYSYDDIIEMGWDIFILEALYLPIPTISAVSNVNSGVAVKWTAVAGASKYEVLRKTANSDWTSVQETSALKLIDKTAVSGTKYTYTVRCSGAEGSSYAYYQNEYYFDTVGKTITYIAAPVIKSFQVGSGKISMQWNSVKGAAKYRVFIKSGSKWKKLADTKAKTYTYKSAKVGRIYAFTVRCISANAKSYTSGYVTTGWKVKALAVPKIKKLQSTASGVKLTWGKVKGAAKYRVFIKSGSKWAKLGDTTGTTFIHNTAKNGKKYIYTVRCVTASGGSYRSAFYTKGWSTIFKKPLDWKSLYRSYVNSHLNSMRWADSTYSVYSDMPFAMHDFDLNGIPELIAGYPGARLGLAVYTVYGGKVVYAGCIGGKSAEYSNNKTYHGIFRWDSWMSGAEGGVSYSYISKGKLVTKDVMDFSYDLTTMKKNETVKNKTLYSVYQSGTNNLKYSSWQAIQSNGWAAFYQTYGY